MRGEILREEFMLLRGLSQNALARALKVPPRRINEIANALEIMQSGAIIAKKARAGHGQESKWEIPV